MDTQQILAIMIEQRGRIDTAIAALQGSPVGGSRKNTRAADEPDGRKGPRTPEQRKAQAERMLAYWEAKRGMKPEVKKSAAKKAR